jgi:hypothetical protein
LTGVVSRAGKCLSTGLCSKKGEVLVQLLRRIYRFLSKAEDRLYKALGVLIFVTICLAVLSVMFQVVYRFILLKFVSFSFPFTDEFSRYMLILGVYLTIPIVMKEGSHPSIDLVRNLLPKKVQEGSVLYHQGGYSFYAHRFYAFLGTGGAKPTGLFLPGSALAGSCTLRDSPGRLYYDDFSNDR